MRMFTLRHSCPLLALVLLPVFGGSLAAQEPEQPTPPPPPARPPEPPQRAEVNAPVKNFRLPVFDEGGHRQWELLGSEALYVDRNEIRVQDMTLRTYAPADPLNPRMLIQSPAALIRPQDGVAEGAGYLYITEANNNYFIIGRDWRWDGKGQRVRIGADVRVTFREKLDQVLH